MTTRERLINLPKLQSPAPIIKFLEITSAKAIEDFPQITRNIIL